MFTWFTGILYKREKWPKLPLNSLPPTLFNSNRKLWRQEIRAANTETLSNNNPLKRLFARDGSLSHLHSSALVSKIYANIMWDRRVYRGNTYAAQVLPLVRVTMLQGQN